MYCDPILLCMHIFCIRLEQMLSGSISNTIKTTIEEKLAAGGGSGHITQSTKQQKVRIER